jgi:HSP20 family protein
MSKKEHKEHKEKKESKEITVTEPALPVSPFEEMEHWFEDFFRRPFFSPMWMPRLGFPAAREVVPSIDVYQDGDDVVVKAELPGLAKEDLEIDITGNVVTISGEKKSEEKVERKDYHRIERSYGSFTRSVRLPAEIQSDLAKASYKDGVLEVRIPKTEEAKKKGRKIEIE